MDEPHSEPCSLTCRLNLGRLYSDISDSESDSQLCARPRWPYAALCPCRSQTDWSYTRFLGALCQVWCRRWPEACKCGSDPMRLRSFPPDAERPSDALREAG